MPCPSSFSTGVPPWSRVARVFRVLLGAAVLLGACAPAIEPTLTVERWSQATDTLGNALPDSCDFLKGSAIVTSVSDSLPPGCLVSIGEAGREGIPPSHIPARERGLPLRVGDVVHLRRWTPGFVRTTENRNHNFIGAQGTTYRLPLRRIATDAPLRDVEREFLATLLTTNRTSTYTGDSDGLSEHLRSKEAVLWNAVVDGLSIRRITTGRGENPLVLTVRGDLVHRHLGEWTSWFRPASQWEVSGIDLPFSTPYEAISDATNAIGKNDQYYRRAGGAASIVDFVSARLGGVSLRSRELPERGWSLLEWQNSGVCGDNARIHSVRLAQTGQRLRVLRGKNANATHYVRVVLDRRQPTRSIRRRGGATGPGVFTRLSWVTRARTISEADLDRLGTQDIRGIRWESVDADTPRFRYSCTFYR